MKKRLAIFLIVVLCICSLTVLTSCDFILDLIFGQYNPIDPNDKNPPSHVHSMQAQTFSGETCVGQQEITYYKCSTCNKCYLDEAGKDEIADVSTLDQGHLFVVKFDDDEHYNICNLCDTEQENSRGSHLSDKWWYTSSEHYKVCDVCGVTFAKSEHDSTTSCAICGRVDYKELCNSHYGYEHLETFEHGDRMQKLYNKIDEAVKAAHDNANVNATNREIGKDTDGNSVKAYAIKDIDASDCLINENDAYITVACYNYDNPLYYWIDKQCGVSYEGSSRRAMSVTICVIDEYANGAKRVAQNEVIYQEIDKYLSYVSSKTDPYAIARVLHDKVIDNIDYALNSDGSAEDEMWAHNIVGVFDKKSAVCEGYAKAFQLLLNACNVNNIYIIGEAFAAGDGSGVGHAWNLVQLDDNKWYWCDLTWDDQPNMPQGKIDKYFCKPDSAFTDHTVSSEKSGLNYFYTLPETSKTSYRTITIFPGI